MQSTMTLHAALCLAPQHSSIGDLVPDCTKTPSPVVQHTSNINSLRAPISRSGV